MKIDPEKIRDRSWHAEFDDDEAGRDDAIGNARVFARFESGQKTTLVETLQRKGGFVAVTGDGVNDAPALNTAHINVAMGKGGTDVARGAHN